MILYLSLRVRKKELIRNRISPFKGRGCHGFARQRLALKKLPARSLLPDRNSWLSNPFVALTCMHILLPHVL